MQEYSSGQMRVHGIARDGSTLPPSSRLHRLPGGLTRSASTASRSASVASSRGHADSVVIAGLRAENHALHLQVEFLLARSSSGGASESAALRRELSAARAALASSGIGAEPFRSSCAAHATAPAAGSLRTIGLGQSLAVSASAAMSSTISAYSAAVPMHTLSAINFGSRARSAALTRRGNGATPQTQLLKAHQPGEDWRASHDYAIARHEREEQRRLKRAAAALVCVRALTAAHDLQQLGIAVRDTLPAAAGMSAATLFVGVVGALGDGEHFPAFFYEGGAGKEEVVELCTRALRMLPTPLLEAAGPPSKRSSAMLTRAQEVEVGLQGLTGHCFRHRVALLVHRPARDDRFHFALDARASNGRTPLALLCCPLVLPGGRCVGVLQLALLPPRPPAATLAATAAAAAELALAPPADAVPDDALAAAEALTPIVALMAAALAGDRLDVATQAKKLTNLEGLPNSSGLLDLMESADFSRDVLPPSIDAANVDADQRLHLPFAPGDGARGSHAMPRHGGQRLSLGAAARERAGVS
ncbi:hypothetical protein T492DRAFT_1064031 [Pavlovales sp. CCMP2436]|nr:hypothetical protein T492DRAFT_1064031 [Pavlovales sp. CCMP2436]